MCLQPHMHVCKYENAWTNGYGTLLGLNYVIDMCIRGIPQLGVAK